jgi:hypothetical protein
METSNEQQGTLVEPTTFEDIMNLASWDRPRDDEEISDFLDVRERELEKNEARARRLFSGLLPQVSQE